MSKAKKKQLDVDKTREALEHLGLMYAVECLSAELSDAVKKNLTAHKFLDRLLNIEIERREERRIKTSLRLSGLPSGQTLEDFDFGFQPGIERKRIETLAACSWLQEQETILFQGPPGVGKTHLAIGLGVKAIECGFSVAYFRFDDLLYELKKDAESPPQKLRRRKHMKAALLIIDEMGFQPMDREEASLFFRMVSYRYQKGSTLITTNKSVKDWAEIFAGDEVMTTALLDRLLHNCHVFNVKGRSYRLRGLESRLKQ